MNAPHPLTSAFHSHREQLKAWPIGFARGERNALLMSDGRLCYFPTYGRAQSFLERHPAPTAREQLDASLWMDRVEARLEQFEAEDTDRTFEEIDNG